MPARVDDAPARRSCRPSSRALRRPGGPDPLLPASTSSKRPSTRTSPIPSSGGAREAANRPPELSHPHLRVPQPSVGRRSAHRPHSPQTREPVHGGAHKGTTALRRCWPSAWAKRGSSPRPGRASTGAQPPWRLRSRAWTAPCPGLRSRRPGGWRPPDQAVRTPRLSPRHRFGRFMTAFYSRCHDSVPRPPVVVAPQQASLPLCVSGNCEWKPGTESSPPGGLFAYSQARLSGTDRKAPHDILPADRADAPSALPGR